MKEPRKLSQIIYDRGVVPNLGNAIFIDCIQEVLDEMRINISIELDDLRAQVERLRQGET